MNIKNHLKFLINKVDNIVVLNDNETKFIYIKISKTAGTYLHRGFFDKYYKKNKYYFNCKDNRKKFDDWLNHENDFDKYFIFSFVRNTFTRIISAYYYSIKTSKRRTIGENVSLKEFILNNEYHNHMKYHIYSQYKTLFTQDDNPKLIVNQIYFYENLESSIQELCKRINIKTYKPIKNKKLMSSNIENHFKYYKDENLYTIVYNRFKDEIDYFNFKII